MADALALATCIIYAILSIPVLYLVVRHIRHGALGWILLFVFCGLRLVGGAMGVSSSSSAAGIISNVGLSPLLLAAAGILHEARTFRIANINKLLDWIIVFKYHLFVVIGVALTAAGSAKLQKQEEPVDKAEKIVKAGIAILTVCWALLVAWTGLSYNAPRSRNCSSRAGTVLLGSVAFSLVFIGIRVFYSLAALVSQKASLNPSTGSLAIRVVLGLLPELIATITFIAAGLNTQNISQQAAKEVHINLQESNEPSLPPYPV